MDDPLIGISKWIHWDSRDRLPGIEQPGVYAIGQFAGRIPTRISWKNLSNISKRHRYDLGTQQSPNR